MTNKPIIRKVKRKNYKPQLIGLMIVLILFFVGLQFYQTQRSLAAKRQEILILEDKIYEAKIEQSRLIAILEQLDTQEYIERVAREELGLVKLGEILIIPIE